MLTDAVGQLFAEHRAAVGETLANLKERIVRLKATSDFEERFAKLAHEDKRRSEVPRGELIEKIVALRRQLDELKEVQNSPAPKCQFRPSLTV